MESSTDYTEHVPSPITDLNPTAMSFQMPGTGYPSPLRARAQTFLPTGVQDVASHTSSPIVDGVTWDSSADVMCLTFDTINVSDYRPFQLHEVITSLVGIGSLPETIQLNVLADAALTLLHVIHGLITKSLGPHMTMVKTVQVTIMRRKDDNGGQFCFSYVPPENLNSLRRFVGELMRTFPSNVQFIWGCSPQFEARLKEYFYYKAAPAVLHALHHYGDNGIAAYSSAVNGKILASIAQRQVNQGLQGRRYDTGPRGLISSGRLNHGPSPSAGPLGASFNPTANTFAPFGRSVANDTSGTILSTYGPASNVPERVPLFVPGAAMSGGPFLHGDLSGPYTPQSQTIVTHAHGSHNNYDQLPSYCTSDYHALYVDAANGLTGIAEHYNPVPAYSPDNLGLSSTYLAHPEVLQSYAYAHPEPLRFHAQPTHGQPNRMDTAPPVHNLAPAAAPFRAPIAVRNPGLYAPSLANISYGNGYENGYGGAMGNIHDGNANFNGYPARNAYGNVNGPRRFNHRGHGPVGRGNGHRFQNTAAVHGNQMPRHNTQIGHGALPYNRNVNVMDRTAPVAGSDAGMSSNIDTNINPALVRNADNFPPLIPEESEEKPKEETEEEIQGRGGNTNW